MKNKKKVLRVSTVSCLFTAILSFGYMQATVKDTEAKAYPPTANFQTCAVTCLDVPGPVVSEDAFGAPTPYMSATLYAYTLSQTFPGVALPILPFGSSITQCAAAARVFACPYRRSVVSPGGVPTVYKCASVYATMAAQSNISRTITCP